MNTDLVFAAHKIFVKLMFSSLRDVVAFLKFWDTIMRVGRLHSTLRKAKSMLY